MEEREQSRHWVVFLVCGLGIAMVFIGAISVYGSR